MVSSDGRYPCTTCGVPIAAEDRATHWDYHHGIQRRLRELEARIEELERERNAEMDARREALERE